MSNDTVETPVQVPVTQSPQPKLTYEELADLLIHTRNKLDNVSTNLEGAFYISGFITLLFGIAFLIGSVLFSEFSGDPSAVSTYALFAGVLIGCSTIFSSLCFARENKEMGFTIIALSFVIIVFQGILIP